MAIPELKEQDIREALKHIDEEGVPFRQRSTKYELVDENGERYPVRYVVAVASHLAKGSEIGTDSFDAAEAKSLLEAQGFTVETKEQEEFKLRVTADDAVSTDERFTMDNLSLGDHYKPLDVYFKKADGTVIRRARNKGEQSISNSTMPRLACQIFEKQLAALSVEEKEAFPTCRYTPGGELYHGIYSSLSEFEKYCNPMMALIYKYDNGRQFVIYGWNIFSTIIFVQECLKRFGQPGDQFILTYREKDKKEEEEDKSRETAQEKPAQHNGGYRNPFSSVLLESKNLIFRGAPGTGKSHLAKEIAADIISNGYYDNCARLTDEQKEQVEFVQFHPSYDYTDFVEGLRPVPNEDGSISFDLKDGVFKQFVNRARKNYEDAHKNKDTIAREKAANESMNSFFESIEPGKTVFKSTSGTEFIIKSVDDRNINITIPENSTSNKIKLSLNDIRSMLVSGREFEKVKDVTDFFCKKNATQGYSYYFTVYHEIRRLMKDDIAPVGAVKEKNYIFIIDEINRGEISKIFGELFFSIDPGYRGKAGEISTQYANMHDGSDGKFYIPENVYIIGTMNDIDRSVDSFDFAMRRRFRFIELKADDRLEMLDSLDDEKLKEEAIRRMSALNEAIVKEADDLNENYQIGAAYFLKLKTVSFDKLWTDYLRPLLQDYVQGMHNEKDLMEKFAKAYGYREQEDGADESGRDQG